MYHELPHDVAGGDPALLASGQRRDAAGRLGRGVDAGGAGLVAQPRRTVGDMVLWDNTGTMHRVMAYPEDSGRLMHRTTVQGDEPFA